MKQVKSLTIVFNNELKAHEIPAFRGAVVKKVGREHVLFHNHLSDTEFVNSYPCIQYKSIGGKPAIFCIEEGVDEMYKFFTKKDWNLELSNRMLELKVERLDMKQVNLQVWDKKFNYRISSWVALNPLNYQKFLKIQDPAERHDFLSKILIGNILSMAKGIGWDVDKPIALKIIELQREKRVLIKGVKVTAFDLLFETNVYLPNNIGLGKSVSHGYGILRHFHTQE